MARPPALQTVDFFPHMTRHGQTLFIIEQRYGNDGYAFWFKLLEMLGSRAGHYLDTTEPDTWEFLQARTLLSEQRCTEILDLLAKLNAIDRDLWTRDRVVWSQNLVDNLQHLYTKRKAGIPQKPGFRCGNSPSTVVSSAEIPQRIGEERKGKEREEPGLWTLEQSNKLIAEIYERDLTICPPQGHPIDMTDHAFSQVLAVYPEPGKQVGVADQQAQEAFRTEIKQCDHGPVVVAAKNYAAYIAAEQVEPRYVKQITNFLRDGFWRNYLHWQPLGRDGPAEKPRTAWREERDREVAAALEQKARIERGEIEDPREKARRIWHPQTQTST